MSDDRDGRIYHSANGTVHLPLGGVDRTLRFRTHEIAELEARRGCGIMRQLDGEQLGLGWLRDAIAVGVAHEFRGSKRNKEKLTEKTISRWIDDCENGGGIEFDELLEAVMRAVVGGMPNGGRLLAAMDEANEGGAEGDDGPPADAP